MIHPPFIYGNSSQDVRYVTDVLRPNPMEGSFPILPFLYRGCGSIDESVQDE